MRSRAGPPHRQQSLFGLRRGHPGQGPDLRIRELPPGEGLARSGSVPRARATRTFSRRPPGRGPPASSARRRRSEPGVPAPAGVELADQVEQARVAARRAPTARRSRRPAGPAPRRAQGVRCLASGSAWRVSLLLRLYTAFLSRLGASTTGDSCTSDDFRCRRPRAPLTGPVRGAGGHPEATADTR